MAIRKRDQDDANPSGELPDDAPPLPQGSAPLASQPGGFLPDDSFLLDVDDESAQAAPTADPNAASSAAPSAGEEWIVVDDDLTAPDAHAPAAEPASLESAHEAAAHEAAPAAEPAATPATKVPKWYGEDESELPAFVAEDKVATGAEATAAAGAAAAVAAESQEQPIAEPLPAPVVSLARARRRKLALVAAAAVVLLGAGAAWWFQMHQVDGGTATDVAIAPKPHPVKPQPVETPVVEKPVEPQPVETPVVEKPVEPPVEPTPPAPRVDPTPRSAPAEPVAKGPTPAPIDPKNKRPLPNLDKSPKAPPGPKDDTIVELRNGHTFRGQITRTKGTHVTLRVGLGECVFDLSEVTLLDSTAPEYRRIDQMPEASVVLASGQHLRGRLMKQTDDHVVLVVNNGQVIFPRTDIKDVSFTGRIHF
jgi:hypothetical protein